MTNYEKFVKVFGFEPDKNSCVIKCPDNERETACKYYDYSDDPLIPNYGCRCEKWWNAEYKEPTTKNEALVSLGVYKQVAWERDIAIQQLHELGYEFGQKIEPTAKNDLGVDWDELKRKILMEVDDGTDDAWLAYGEVCNRISNSIDEFVADIRGEDSK